MGTWKFKSQLQKSTNMLSPKAETRWRSWNDPTEGLSVVLADGQSSGRGAKAVSMMVVRKVIGLLAEGVRDGAAARAASDALYTEKGGKVSSTLNIASLDMHHQIHRADEE